MKGTLALTKLAFDSSTGPTSWRLQWQTPLIANPILIKGCRPHLGIGCLNRL